MESMGRRMLLPVELEQAWRTRLWFVECFFNVSDTGTNYDPVKLATDAFALLDTNTRL